MPFMRKKDWKMMNKECFMPGLVRRIASLLPNSYPLINKSLCALALLFMGATAACGQSFDIRWIGSPVPDSASNVWFRRTFVVKERPLKAWITVATTGNCDVYVNEWNVGSGFSVINRQLPSDEPVAATFDITSLLRTDSNTVGIWYAPSLRLPNARQVGVTLFGIDRKGRRFAHYSGGDWLCRQANRTLKTDGGEVQDGIAGCEGWNANRMNVALWRPAEVCKQGEGCPVSAIKEAGGVEKGIGVRKPRYFDTVGDTVFYEFGEPFYGFVRITLRDCKRGEIIHFGDFDYTCNGRIDEQAYPKFARFYGRRLMVCGDGHFRREQIQSIEIVEVSVGGDFLF